MARGKEERLAQCALTLKRAVAERDQWIAAMRDEGFSLREIAVPAQMSPEGVKQVLLRDPRPAVGKDPEQRLRACVEKARAATDQRAQLLLALRPDLTERRLAELSGLSRTAVRHQIAQAEAGLRPQVVRARF